MDDLARDQLISQAKAKASSIFDARLKWSEEAYDPEPNARVIGDVIKEASKEFPDLDFDDVSAAVLAAYHEWFVDDRCEVFSKAAEHIQSAYQAGLDTGYEFGAWHPMDDLVDEFETYMKHVHDGDSDAVSVFHGFAKWWSDGSGDGGPFAADMRTK